ncbi:N-acetylglucosamine-6-phosphate deacetylase [Lapillicoccus sp.]|uniref:N-acetylglucosamine-6-phosphate deacetylase n=1 Tax=Lapillicoccus sp. TaxID=1909287 RepID=UPI003983BD25
MDSNGTMLLRGRVVTRDGVLEDGVVLVVGDRIRFVGHAADLPPEDVGAPVPPGWERGATLLPGLVDGHCHGGAGGEFGPSAEGAHLAVSHHHRSGTTSLLGSLVSAAPDVLFAGVSTCAALVATGALAGIHLEGPFLSMARRGAQNPAALTDVDESLVEALVQAATDAGVSTAVTQMTYAPERPGGDRLPTLLSRLGIIPALGHTDADVDTAWASLRQAREVAPRGGRPLVTHVFNGMPSLHHRAPGPVAAALAQAAQGDAVLEVIGDGVHLAPGTVRMLFDVVGPHNLMLVTDSMAASGMPDGRYTLGGQDVLVAGRAARLAEGGSIAGGVATLLDVVRWCVTQAGVCLHDAVTSASLTPATALALSDVGALVAGRRADVLVVDDRLHLRRVLRRGEWLPMASPPATGPPDVDRYRAT